MVQADRANNGGSSEDSPIEAGQVILPETYATSICTLFEDDRSCKMAAHAGVCRD